MFALTEEGIRENSGRALGQGYEGVEQTARVQGMGSPLSLSSYD